MSTSAHPRAQLRGNNRLDFSSFDLVNAPLALHFCDMTNIHDEDTYFDHLYFPAVNQTEITIHFNDSRWLTVNAYGDFSKATCNQFILDEPLKHFLSPKCQSTQPYASFVGGDNDDLLTFSAECQNYDQIVGLSGNDQIIIKPSQQLQKYRAILINGGPGNDTFFSAPCVEQNYKIEREPYAVDTIYNFNTAETNFTHCEEDYERDRFHDVIRLSWMTSLEKVYLNQRRNDTIISLPNHQKIILKNTAMHWFTTRSSYFAEYKTPHYQRPNMPLAIQNGTFNINDEFWMGPWPNYHYRFYDFEVARWVGRRSYGGLIRAMDTIQISNLPLKPDDKIEVDLQPTFAHFTFPHNISLAIYTDKPEELFVSELSSHYFYQESNPLDLSRFNIPSWPNKLTDQRGRVVLFHPVNKTMTFHGFKMLRHKYDSNNDFFDLSLHPITHLSSIMVYAEQNDTVIDLPNGYKIYLPNVDAKQFFTFSAGTLNLGQTYCFERLGVPYLNQWPRSKSEDSIIQGSAIQGHIPIINNQATHYVEGFHFFSNSFDLSSFNLNEQRKINLVCNTNHVKFDFQDGNIIIVNNNSCNTLFVNPRFSEIIFIDNIGDMGLNNLQLDNQTLTLSNDEYPSARTFTIPRGNNLIINIYNFTLKSILDFSFHPTLSTETVMLTPTDDENTYISIANNISIILHQMYWLSLYNAYAGNFIYESFENAYEQPLSIFKMHNKGNIPQQITLTEKNLTMRVRESQKVCYLPANHTIVFQGSKFCNQMMVNLNESIALESLLITADRYDAIITDETNSSVYRLVNTSAEYMLGHLKQIAPKFIRENGMLKVNYVRKEIQEIEPCYFHLNEVPHRVIVGEEIMNFFTAYFFSQSIADTNCHLAYLFWSNGNLRELSFPIINDPLMDLPNTQIPLPYSNWKHNDYSSQNFTLKIKYGRNQLEHDVQYSVIFERQIPAKVYGGYSFKLDGYGKILSVVAKPDWLELDNQEEQFYGTVPNDYPFLAYDLQFFARKNHELLLVKLHLSYNKTNEYYLAFVTAASYAFALYLCLASYRFFLANSGKAKAIRYEIVKQKPNWLVEHDGHFEKVVAQTLEQFMKIRETHLPHTPKTELAQMAASMLFLLRPYPLIKKQVHICMQNILTKLDCDLPNLSNHQRASIVNQAAFGAFVGLYQNFPHYDQLCSYFSASEVKLLIDSYNVDQQIEITRQFSNGLIDVSNNHQLTLSDIELQRLNRAKEQLRNCFISPTDFPFPVNQQQYAESLTTYFEQCHAIMIEVQQLALLQQGPALHQ